MSTKTDPNSETDSLANEDCRPVPCSAGWFIVSVVMVRDIPTGINTQNKLYATRAVSPEEAHGKAIALISKDFPEHRFHTVCSYPVNSLPNA